ncbi:hypothetical protein D9757_004210 [Collybiopsis confluens]|uniref:RNI-like protein n=1 Tax=Collybiopsis confluens TaxID=2823264 RepID=A0A8H5HUP3_9AGAR|nr:hypothetical protein D9757_004210 [Collybiopsis confluens]
MFSRQSPPKALSLSGRSQIECIDASLTGLAGAKQVIELIRSRRTVTKLILGHNSLSDDGCMLLFNFLSSLPGRKYPITEISLNANRIGNRGLAAIAAYLVGNTTLGELFLQDNLFHADADTVLEFAGAINQSRLRLLSLTTNRFLSDTFASLFFPALCSRHLQELHLSAVGLTRRSAPFITDYITSPGRCRLHTLKCNGNSLAFHGVRAIIRAIERANFSLTLVEMYSNSIMSGPGSSEDTDGEDGESHSYGSEPWKDMEKLLKQVLRRNSDFKKETGNDALCLLRYSRTVLCRSKKPFDYEASSSPVSRIGFPFRDLPIEIQLHILSFLAPILSASQRARISTYASSPSTLPSLLPSLNRLHSSPYRNVSEPALLSACVSDSSITWGLSASGASRLIENAGSGSRCAPGTCMGNHALLCNIEVQRTAWLEQMDCLYYDAELELETA